MLEILTVAPMGFCEAFPDFIIVCVPTVGFLYCIKSPYRNFSHSGNRI